MDHIDFEAEILLQTRIYYNDEPIEKHNTHILNVYVSHNTTSKSVKQNLTEQRSKKGKSSVIVDFNTW